MYGHKKDHGIVDNGHTMRWRYHDIPWFMLNGCRWFGLLVHTKELMKDCSRVNGCFVRLVGSL